MEQKEFGTITAAHFIGIGGIGVSAIARMFLLEGIAVSGSDRDGSRITEELAEAGAKVFIGHNAKHIPEVCDCVIYTVAIPEDNPELVEAKRRGLRLLTYPQTLDIISRQKFTIAISGTHGKTTTTAMVASIMLDAGLDPTVIVGSLMKDIKGGQSNFIAGKSEYLVVEADEYRKSFHNIQPKILVINNIDEDHLDFYKDLTDIQESFAHVLRRVPPDGVLICNTKDPHLALVIKEATCKVVNYEDCKLSVPLKIPGEHNRSNARAAVATAVALGISQETAEASIATFGGVWRRFEYKGVDKNGIQIFDDYAHNPQKVKAVLAGAREYLGKKARIRAVFQPHLYSRTKILLKGFGTSFEDADEVLLAPIYAAREPHDPSISSAIFGKEIEKNGKKVVVFDSFRDIETYLHNTLRTDDVVITIGAGDIHKVGEALLDKNLDNK